MFPPKITPTTSRGRSARPTYTTTVGPWQLVRLLGAGEWTQAFQARPKGSATEASADYTVKIIRPKYQDDPLAIGLLQREAFVSQQVQHPHLVSILSAHVESPPRFVVLPYLEGVTVRGALRSASRLNVPHALWIARQVASALQALHRQEWLHCDVKPDNIFVSENGHTTLLDLGFATSLTSPREREMLASSLAYAPPETFNPNVAFRAESDIYSLGITLYEMLTGELPFAELNATDLAAAHLVKPPPEARRIVPQLPASVSRLVRRTLAKDPLRRPNAEELIDWLVALEVETFEERVSG
jgi:serine/threonine-protein kinase